MKVENSLLHRRTFLGFTLAEVMITLAIIGLVAEMTIPTLMNSVQNAQFRNGFKNMYSTTTQAVSSIATDYGSLSGTYSDNDTLRDVSNQ